LTDVPQQRAQPALRSSAIQRACAGRSTLSSLAWPPCRQAHAMLRPSSRTGQAPAGALLAASASCQDAAGGAPVNHPWYLDTTQTAHQGFLPRRACHTGRWCRQASCRGGQKDSKPISRSWSDLSMCVPSEITIQQCCGDACPGWAVRGASPRASVSGKAPARASCHGPASGHPAAVHPAGVHCWIPTAPSWFERAHHHDDGELAPTIVVEQQRGRLHRLVSLLF